MARQAFKVAPGEVVEPTALELARAGGAFQAGRIERAGQITVAGFAEQRRQLDEFRKAIEKARKKAILSDAIMIGLGLGGIALGLPAVAVGEISRLGATAISGQLPSPEVQAGIGAGASIAERKRFKKEQKKRRAFISEPPQVEFGPLPGTEEEGPSFGP